MNNNDLILESQKYIEKHLEEKLLVSDIAHVLGYSEYHFSRMFSQYTGISVMEYVKQRRLMQAADDIIHGMKIIDAAMKFSYDSHSGFTKAFKKEFGYSPSLLSAFKMQIDDIIGGSHMSKLFIRQMKEHESKEELFGILLESIKTNEINYDITNINKAYDISKKAYEGIQRYSGDEYVTHPLNVAIILAELGAGENAIIAGFMCDIIKKTRMNVKEIKDTIEETYSKDLLTLVQGVWDFDITNATVQDDIVIVKLAERLHNMRTLKYMDENSWRDKAKETVEIYIPIARRYGNKALIEELNKLSIDNA